MNSRRLRRNRIGAADDKNGLSAQLTEAASSGSVEHQYNPLGTVYEKHTQANAIDFIDHDLPPETSLTLM